MKGKTVERNNDCELEKFRERLINENEALNKLLRNIQNPVLRTKGSSDTRTSSNAAENKSK